MHKKRLSIYLLALALLLFLAVVYKGSRGISPRG